MKMLNLKSKAEALNNLNGRAQLVWWYEEKNGLSGPLELWERIERELEGAASQYKFSPSLVDGIRKTIRGDSGLWLHRPPDDAQMTFRVDAKSNRVLLVIGQRDWLFAMDTGTYVGNWQSLMARLLAVRPDNWSRQSL